MVKIRVAFSWAILGIFSIEDIREAECAKIQGDEVFRFLFFKSIPKQNCDVLH